MRQKNLVYLQQYSHLLIINIKKKKNPKLIGGNEKTQF